MRADRPVPAGTALFLPFLVLSLLAAGSCGRNEPIRQTRFLMGTLVEIGAWPDAPSTARAVDDAFKRMAEVEVQARPVDSSSPLVRLREGQASDLTADLARILALSRRVADASAGAFDPSLGPVVRLWGFDVDSPHLPDPGGISKALAGIGFGRLSIEGGRADPHGRPVDLELGGVAKGYAVDEALQVLTRAGVRAAVVNAGGDLAVLGERPGRPAWRIGIQDPDDPQALIGVLSVREGAVATSGDYERYFDSDGVRYHHILDPKTGYPARSGLRSVTVLAATCVEADALATAVFVLGAEKGLELLRGWGSAEGLLVDDRGAILKTEGIGRDVSFEKR